MKWECWEKDGERIIFNMSLVPSVIIKEIRKQRMRKVYISGPITGKEEQESRQAFAEAEALLQSMGYRTIDPWDIADIVGTDITHRQAMEIDLAILRTCDAIYMLKGWQDSDGCRKERGCAEWNDLIIMEEE